MTWDGSGSARRRRIRRLVQFLEQCQTPTPDEALMSDPSLTPGDRRSSARAWQDLYLPPGTSPQPVEVSNSEPAAPISFVPASVVPVSTVPNGAFVDLFTQPVKPLRPPRFHLAWCVVGMAGCMSLSAPRTTFEPIGQVNLAGATVPAGPRPASASGLSRSGTSALGGTRESNPEASPEADLGDPVSITPIPRTDRQETSGRRNSATPSAPALMDEETFSRPDVPANSRVVPDAFGSPEEESASASPPELTIPEVSPAPSPALESGSSQPVVELAVVDPASRQVGAGATFRVTLTNRSTTAVDNVRVVCEFAEELQFGTSTDKLVSQPLGVWAARESKDLALTLHASKPGTFEAAFRIERESDGEVLAERRGRATFVDRRYELSLIGPTERTIGSRAEFTVRIANTSTDTLSPTDLILKRDAALVLKELTEGSRRSAGEIRWSLPELAPGAETQFQAEFECRTAADRAVVSARLGGSDGSSSGVPEEETEATIQIVPVTGVLDVRVADTVDPLAVGDEGSYRLTITNLGLQEVRRIKIRCEATDQIELSTVSVTRGKEPLTTQFVPESGGLVGDEIDTLAADATLTVEVRSTARSAGRGELTVVVEHEVPGSRVEIREPTWVTP